MAMFGALSTAGSGLTVYRTWLDAVSDNIANLNTLRPTSGPAYQRRQIVAETTADGVRVGGVVFGSAEGRLVYQPDHPFADAQGMVRAPDVDLGSEMVDLMIAQRSYQANLAVIDRARDSYQQAIQLGT